MRPANRSFPLLVCDGAFADDELPPPPRDKPAKSSIGFEALWPFDAGDGSSKSKSMRLGAAAAAFPADRLELFEPFFWKLSGRISMASSLLKV